MVNHHRDMWRKRSHILTPSHSTDIEGCTVDLTEEHQAAFEEMNRVMSQETLLTFPDFNKEFHVYVDASKY